MYILIVDDESVQRRILGDFLKEQGYKVLEAQNGKEAISIFKNHFCPLVLLDHRMPDMNGDEVMAELKAINPLVKVIMITAYGEIDTAVKVMKLGAKDFLEKPVDLKKLLLKLEKLLEDIEIERETRDVLTNEEKEVAHAFKLVGKSKALKEVISTAKRVAETSWPVLLIGETGTGKELIARLIHDLSPRKDRPFVAVNCATFSETLFESELFGHVKGAFTGATKDKDGLFKVADKGTIFLDEIGEMPLGLQAKLLRVLQEGTIKPVGASRDLKVDVRIISATNRDLNEMIEEGDFRKDLFFRLNVFEINLPPLRERKEDIPELLEFFLKKYAPSKKIRIMDDAMDIFLKYHWPGNIRELEHQVQRIVTLVRGNIIKASDIHLDLGEKLDDSSPSSLKDKIIQLEKKEIQRALKEAGGIQTKAAQILGLSERVLRYKLKKLGIK